MTPEELLQHHPRETLRWLRARLGLTQLALSLELDAPETTVGRWEARQHRISPAHRAQLGALLEPHLATPAGAAFLQSLARGAVLTREG